MSDFSFTATAQCELCGNYLESSDADCDHDGQKVQQQFFRRITSGNSSEGQSASEKPHTVAIEATNRWKWYALARELGDDWIAYEWLGPRSQVESMLKGSMWDDVDDLPNRTMSLDAPSDVSEEA